MKKQTNKNRKAVVRKQNREKRRGGEGRSGDRGGGDREGAVLGAEERLEGWEVRTVAIRFYDEQFFRDDLASY